MISPLELTEIMRRTAIRLSRPDILFWTLPLMMILLIVGTIAQKEMGLYAAQEKYFSSFLTWLGPLPFPGGYSLMALFFVNLLMKFLLFSEWSWRKTGIILSHFGVLLLILGGLFTAMTEQEGSMVIGQGETESVIEDYNLRELRIRRDGVVIYTRPHQDLSPGLVITDNALPFSLRIDTYCFNCSISARPEQEQDGWTSPGKFMKLSSQPDNPQHEINMTGIEFTIEDKKYLTFDKFPKPPQLKHDGHTYTIEIGRAERTLPFDMTLQSFERELHPGTDLAKSYQSRFILTDGDLSWPADISMNEPLRYKGYTFYQSSFDLSGDRPYTVLSVVRNTGRLFPYIASLVIALGLLIHLVQRINDRRPV